MASREVKAILLIYESCNFFLLFIGIKEKKWKTKNKKQKTCISILRMRLMIKEKNLLPTRYSMNLPMQTVHCRALRARCTNEGEERPVSTRGV